MAKYSIQVGSTSQTVNIWVQNSATTAGGALTGLTATGVTGYYFFARQAPVAITLVTTTVATGVFATGAFIEISSANAPGWYRVDVPNASLASGQGNFVNMHFFGGTNMAPVPVEIELTVVNNQSSTYGLASTLPVNVTSWAGASTATTQSAIATTPAVNAIQWAGASTATTQIALATLVNVTQWSGFAAATTQLAVATGVSANLASTALTSIWTYAVDGAVTAQESLRLANSANGGIVAGATTSNLTINNLANTATRVNATVDGVGNRTAVTLNLT